MCHYRGIIRNTNNESEETEAGTAEGHFFHDRYVSFDGNNKSYQNDEYCVMMDGEIYNHSQLRKIIQDDELGAGTSHAELVAALFVKYKQDAFKYLRGKFSIIIWDKKDNLLYGARDPFGIKPLFYQETEEETMFSSTKKSISSVTNTEEINHDALQHYLSFQFVPEPMTMSTNIKKVEPGHYFIKKPDETILFERYWHSSFHPVLSGKKDWIKRIQDVLYDSVHVHMHDDLPIGAFLSGGIDSTIIVAMAKEVHPTIKTFSVGFEREGFSEVNVAKETADKLNVENISYVVSPEEYVEKLPEIMWHMGDPLADPSCVPLYFIAREARKHVSAVLSGEGSDELFGGYNIYREPESLKVFNSLPMPAKSLLAKIAVALPEGVRGKSFLQRGTTPLRDRYIGNAKMFEETEKSQLLHHYNANLSYHQLTSPLFDHVENDPLVNQMQYIDIHTWMRGDILLKANNMTMANAIELRAPFLDKEVFNVASGIPVDLKIANGTTKYILREAARGIIPDHVLDRKKLGFPVPIRHWLKDELHTWAKQLIQESGTDYLLHKSYVLNLFDAHCQGKADYSRKIWTVLVFMLWHQIFVENKFDFAKKHQSNKKDDVARMG